MSFLDESRALYEKYGRELIHGSFPRYEGRIAAGLAGHGSQCFGYDDEISRDHDFEPGFCLWLTDEDDAAIGDELRRAYGQLPFEKAGKHSALGDGSVGVQRISDFYRRYTGSSGAPEELMQWLYLPSHALAEAANGEVWRDDLGAFTKIRDEIKNGMPEDVRLKKLAACAAAMAQSGQYNYSRCLKRGEQGAAMLAADEFVRAAAQMIFLLNRRHMPYYKWLFRALGELEILGDMREALEFLLTGDNDSAGQETKAGVIEDISAAVIRELRAQKLSRGSWDYLEPHAFEITALIKNPELRSLHVMEGI
ncbi:MAG: DUF4037 domain-containing protein [Candidatus Limivicinus sp.]|jgi:hypothetical protein